MIDRAHRRDYVRQILRGADAPLSTTDIHKKLVVWVDRHGDAGDVHDKKTTLRDLELLKKLKYVDSDASKADKRLLLWKAVGRSHSLVLSPTDAMSLTAVFQHAERFGLQLATDELKGLREYAELVMQDGAERKLDYTKRLTSGTRFTLLQPGQYNPEHLKRVQRAILDGSPLEVGYRPRDVGGVECTYQLTPLGLSYQDSNIYLSAYIVEEDWPGEAPDPGLPRGKYSSNGPNKLCALMLHRITQVGPGKRNPIEPEGYDIHSDEAQKDLVSIHSPPQLTRLRLSDNLYNRLSENPLDINQTLAPYGDSWLLTCEIRDTQGLRLFLMANAADIEVLEPQALRDHVHKLLSAAVKNYGT
jgi:predicted DNA-binding transcriptional regulator YafY